MCVLYALIGIKNIGRNVPMNVTRWLGIYDNQKVHQVLLARVEVSSYVSSSTDRCVRVGRVIGARRAPLRAVPAVAVAARALAAARWCWRARSRRSRTQPAGPAAHLPRRGRRAARRRRAGRGEARRARPAAAAPRTTTRARRPARGQRVRRGPGPSRDRNTRTVDSCTAQLLYPAIRAASGRLAKRRGCARAATRRLGRRSRELTTAPEHYFGSDAPRRCRRPPASRCQFYAKLRAGGDAICTARSPATSSSASSKVLVLRTGSQLLTEHSTEVAARTRTRATL